MSNIRRFTPVSEWEDARQILGLEGERLAIAYLTSCGWSIEAHRFRLGRHDVDLVIAGRRHSAADWKRSVPESNATSRASPASG
jgi:hypothetical protein